MSRQSQTNTFNEGLNKDLNPILTPNNVMTDCLNGTIITYNGNEFALQNDLGNYAFKHGILSEGFVPVGIKEYANILYIISYNPINDEVEVGSFPSMKLIDSSTINNDGNTASIKLEEGWTNYTDIETQLTFLSELKDDFLLNPGDEYILIRDAKDPEDNSNGYTDEDYETLAKTAEIEKSWMNTSVFVYTENKKLYNIDDYIDWDKGEQSMYTSDDFKHVKWEIPGWIVVKPTVNVMDEFNCYLEDQEYKFNSDGVQESTTATIKIQSTWNHKMYRDVIKDYIYAGSDLSIIDNLGYLVYSYSDSRDKIDWLEIIGYNRDTDTSDLKTWENKENNLVNYNDIHDVIYSSIKVKDCKDDYLAIVPVLRVNTEGENSVNMDSDNKFIIYDQFTTVLKLKAEKFDPSSVKIGESLFKYYVGENSMTMHLSVESNSDCRLFYRLLYWTSETEMAECAPWEELMEFDNNGQNIFSIDYFYSEDGADCDGKFNKEDLYVIQFYVSADKSSGFIESIPKDINSTEGFIQSCFKEFVVYCSEYVNIYYKPYDSYADEEFTLNESSFAAAVENGLKIKNPIKEDLVPESSTHQDIAYRHYTGSDESFDFSYDSNTNELSGEYLTTVNGYLMNSVIVDDANKNIFNKYALFRYGSKYTWNFGNEIKFVTPEGHGRLWKNISASQNSEDFLISAYDNNYNIVGLEPSINENGEKLYSLPITSESKLFIDPVVETKEGASEDKVIHFGKVGSYRPVSLQSNGYWTLNFVAILWKDWTGNNAYSTTFVSPSLPIQFKVKNSDSIEVRVGPEQKKCMLNRVNDEWRWEGDTNFWDLFKDCSPRAVFAPGSWDWTNAAGWTKNSLENHISCPWLIIARNNIEPELEKYFKSNDGHFNGFNIFSRQYKADSVGSNLYIRLLETTNGIIAKENVTTGGREHMFVGMPISSSDFNNNFSSIFATRNRSWNLNASLEDSSDTENVNNYIAEMFAIYFLMVDRIRYCDKSEIINKYILNFDVTHSIASKKVIKSIEYKLSNTSWKYKIDGTLRHGNISINTSNDEGLSKFISNLVFSEEENINKVFYNMNDNNISTAVDKYKEELNNELSINEDIHNLKAMSEVRSNTFYLTSDDDKYKFSDLINLMKYENGKIIYQSPMSWPDYFKVRYSKNGNTDEKCYHQIGSIGSYFFKE